MAQRRDPRGRQDAVRRLGPDRLQGAPGQDRPAGAAAPTRPEPRRAAADAGRGCRRRHHGERGRPRGPAPPAGCKPGRLLGRAAFADGRRLQPGRSGGGPPRDKRGARMSDRLQALKAERDQIEANEEWDHAALPWLCEEIEKLEATEKTTAPVQAPAATEPEGDAVAALASEMEAMLASPERYSDLERDALVDRFNAQVLEAGAAGAERVDVAQLARDMLGAGDSSALTDEQRAELSRRYDAAVAQPAERRTVEVLRGILAGDDLAARMAAATELQQRGLLADGVADALVTEYQFECEAANDRGLDVEALPPELQEAARGVLEATAALEVPPDPADTALHQLNTAIGSMKPPTVAEQLEALGVQPEQVPEEASQEA